MNDITDETTSRRNAADLLSRESWPDVPGAGRGSIKGNNATFARTTDSSYVFEAEDDKPEVFHEGAYLIVVVPSPTGTGWEGHAVSTGTDRQRVRASSKRQARELAVAKAKELEHGQVLERLAV